MNKKGWLINIIGGLIVIFVAIVLISFIQNRPVMETECISQCELKDLNFSSFTGGGYSNYMCNCINKTTGEIKTIYSK